MKNIIIGLFFAATVVSSLAAQNQINKPQRPVDWYLQQYPFIQYKGIVYSFENQFDWPGGFERLDSAKLTPYQSWVSNLPLWFRERPIGSLKYGKIYSPDSVSRAVHLPWRTAEFTDRIIPLHLVADYLFIKGQDEKLCVITLSGDTLTFDRFLTNTVAYGPKQEMRWIPGDRRTPTEDEYNRYVSLIASNTNYRSLLSNCVPVADSGVLPGDIYINCDSLGQNGRVAVNLVVVENNNGHRLYIFGTGCPGTCDFHIPLFNGRRDYPWTTTEEVASMMGPSKGITGFYRVALPTVKR